MALSRKSNKLTLKSKRGVDDQCAPARTVSCVDAGVAVDKQGEDDDDCIIIDESVVNTAAGVAVDKQGEDDDDCIIIDESVVNTAAASSVQTSKVVSTLSEDNSLPCDEIPSDLQNLRKLLLKYWPSWSFDGEMPLSDLPGLQDSIEGETTSSPIFDSVSGLSPLPQPCRYCFVRKLPQKDFA